MEIQKPSLFLSKNRLNLFLLKGCDSLFFCSQLRGVFHTIFVILDLFFDIPENL